ncbi:hypothetical protein TNCV_1974711 [Trichonephila clavipes]|nr:hypothetical protein TNCV_1974711 [Trichonephila clavipes]
MSSSRSCVRRLCGNNHHMCNFELLRSTILYRTSAFDITWDPFPSLTGCNEMLIVTTHDPRAERWRTKEDDALNFPVSSHRREPSSHKPLFEL